MIIRSFDQDLPKSWKSQHLGYKLDTFTKNFVLGKVLGTSIIKKSEITFLLIDKEKLMLKYAGVELGIISQVGLELIFVSED
jgi:hypothetical protein